MIQEIRQQACAKATVALSAVVLTASLGITGASAQTPFYAGKQLSMLINFGAGSSTDIEARTFGRHRCLWIFKGCASRCRGRG